MTLWFVFQFCFMVFCYLCVTSSRDKVRKSEEFFSELQKRLNYLEAEMKELYVYMEEKSNA